MRFIAPYVVDARRRDDMVSLRGASSALLHMGGVPGYFSGPCDLATEQIIQ